MDRSTSPTRLYPLPRAFNDIAILTRRNLLFTLRLPQVLVFSTLQPITTLVLFTYVLGGAIAGILPPAANGSYLNWLLPGLLAQYGVFSGGQTAAGLTDDLAKGVIDRFRSLPMARSAVLAGRTLSDLVRTAFILALLLAAGLLFGFRPQTSFLGVLSALAVALFFSFAWSWVMVVVGLIVRTTEAVQVVGYLFFFPLTFASSVFVPTQTMPGWVRWFTAYQPVSVVTNALRGLILGPGALPGGQTIAGQVALGLGWSIGLTAIFAWLAVHLYQRASQ